MQTGIRKKVESTSGATLMLALLIFLVLAVFGAMMLRRGLLGASRMTYRTGPDAQCSSLLGTCETLRDAILEEKPQVTYESVEGERVYRPENASGMEGMIQSVMKDPENAHTGTIQIQIPVSRNASELKEFENLEIRMRFLKEDNVLRMEIQAAESSAAGVLEWDVTEETWTDVKAEENDGETVFVNKEMGKTVLTHPVISLEVPDEK